MANRSNTNKIDFPGAPQTLVDGSVDIDHVGLWSAATGGTFYGGIALTNNPDAVDALGQVYSVASGAVVVTMAMQDFADAMAARILDSGLGEVFLGLHNGVPGANGTNAEQTGVAGYARKPLSAYTYTGRTASNSGAIDFDGALQTMVDGSVDMTHYSFWTALTGGTFLGDDTFSNNPDAISALGQVLGFADGALDIVAAAGGLNDAFIQRVFAGGIGTVFLSLHEGNPGTTGTNEETGIAGFARQEVAAWS